MIPVRTVLLCCLLLAGSVLCLGQDVPGLRVSLPPVFASLPIAYAAEWGLFEEHGVDVEIIGMTDNQVRSAALSAGELQVHRQQLRAGRERQREELRLVADDRDRPVADAP